MPVHIEHCANLDCGRMYQVERCSSAFLPDQQCGVVHCPHCYALSLRDPLKVYRTSAVPREWEDWPETTTDEPPFTR